MKSVFPRCLVLLTALAFSLEARADFSPGPNPITGTTGAQTLSSGTGTVATGGKISTSGGTVGVTMSGTNTSLVNSGSILQTGTGRAVQANGTNLSIQNNSGGVIQTQSSDGIRAGNSNSATSISLTNDGRIEVLAGDGGQAIDWAGITSGANSITNTGTIRDTGEDAVRPGANGIVTNSGTIQAIMVGDSGSDGIQASSSGVQVFNTGSISGRHGITGGRAPDDPDGPLAINISVTNNVGGTISGASGSGINIDNLSSTATVTNRGTITGGSTTGDSDGIDVDGTLTLNNYGIIRSLDASGAGNNSEGLAIGGGSVTNYAGGEITGQIVTGAGTGVGRGITVDDSSGGGAVQALTLDNSGLIRGYSGAGISIAGNFADTITNQSGGVIRGGGSEAAIQMGGGNDTLTNRGAIQADGTGAAVDLGAGDDTMRIFGNSASIVGNVSGGSGTNTLEIGPGTGGTFSYGGQFSNFSAVNVTSGRVILTGASTYSGGTTIAGGAALFANNTLGSATGTGAVTVQNLGLLGGSGRIGGNVSLANGGVIAPGNSPGTLSIGGSLSLVDGSRFAFDLGPNAASSDLLTIDGQLIFSGSGKALFDFTNNGIQVGTYTLLTFNGSSGLDLSKFDFGAAFDPGFTANFVLDADSLSLNVTAIPEPATTAALLGACALAVVLWRRRSAARASAAA